MTLHSSRLSSVRPIICAALTSELLFAASPSPPVPTPPFTHVCMYCVSVCSLCVGCAGSVLECVFAADETPFKAILLSVWASHASTGPPNPSHAALAGVLQQAIGASSIMVGGEGSLALSPSSSHVCVCVFPDQRRLCAFLAAPRAEQRPA